MIDFKCSILKWWYFKNWFWGCKFKMVDNHLSSFGQGRDCCKILVLCLSPAGFKIPIPRSYPLSLHSLQIPLNHIPVGGRQIFPTGMGENNNGSVCFKDYCRGLQNRIQSNSSINFSDKLPFLSLLYEGPCLFLFRLLGSFWQLPLKPETPGLLTSNRLYLDYMHSFDRNTRN
jgi:hypothetical protein